MATQIFDDVRLPVNIEQNAVCGPTFFTTVLTNQQGKEQRVQNWLRQRMAYEISYGIQQSADYETVLAFFYARAGRARAFRFKDWTDYKAIGSAFATGDGTTTQFQLARVYSDTANTFKRRITRPVDGTLVLYLDGAVSTIGWTLGDLGLLTFNSAPTAGAIISADFEFDVPVRFDSDVIQLTAPIEEVATIGQIKLLELME